MRLAELALRRPVTTIMVFVSVVVVGLIAAQRLPLEYLPNVEAPFLVVRIPYQGSSPEEVERLITRPVEDVLATMSGIKRMRSRSSSTGSTVILVLDWDQDVTVKAIEARELIGRIRNELPEDVRYIRIRKFSTTDRPVINLRLSSETRDLSNAYTLLNREFRRPLERVRGVSRVELYGVLPREIRIELNPAQVAAHDISLNRLRRRLRAANFAVSAGQVTAHGTRYRVKPVSGLQSVHDIRNLVINSRGLELSDIATITYAPPERDSMSFLNRQPAVGMLIYKERGANVVAVGRRVTAELEEIQQQPALQGIEVLVVNNQATGVINSLYALGEAGIVGAILAMLVLYAFLRDVPTTLMVVLSVPIAMCCTLACMYFLGLSLNILTMMGLLLAVGMLVDNSVVVSESIYRQHENQPEHPRRAALVGTHQVALAITAGTLTTIIVFAPNLFGGGGRMSIFLGQVAAGICISLVASLLIALTIIPLIASRLKPPKERKGGIIQRTRDGYTGILRWTLRHGWASALIIALTVLSVLIPLGQVKTDMFGSSVERELELDYNLHTDYPLDMVRQAVDKVEDYLFAHKEAFEIASIYSEFSENGRAETRLMLTTGEKADKSVAEIKEAIRQGLPELAIGDLAFDTGWRGRSGLQITLLGESSARLQEIAANLERVLSQVDGLVDVESEAEAGTREVLIRVNRERALRLGFATREVARAIAVALRGRQVSQLRVGGKEVPIRLLFEESRGRDLAQLRKLTLTRDDGTQIPLAALVDISISTGPPTIVRKNRQTALSVSYALDGISRSLARERIRDVMDSFALPAGYEWQFGRAFSRSRDAQSQMVFNLLLAVAIIYLLLAALFESLVYPAAIMSTIVFSVIGVFWFFLITGTNLSMMAMIGMLILIGVVVNNGIVLIDRVNQLREQGMQRTEAVVQGGRDRLRPILMTVATTVLGMAPLCFSNTQVGGQGPPYFPMARAIVGGLLFSTAVSLLFLPSIYVYLDDLRHWSRELFRRGSGRRPLLVKKPDA